MFATIMRFFSYAYHLLLALFMLGISLVSLTGGATNLQIGILPWQNRTLAYVLLGSAVVAIAVVLLAAKRMLPVLLLAWSAVVFVMLVRGYLFSPYHFENGYSTPIYLTLGAVLALVGGWVQFRQKPEKVRPAAYGRSVTV